MIVLLTTQEVEEYVCDSVGNDNDFHILCTLDMVILMKVEEDLSNLPNTGVVFSGTNFMTADDWHDQEEVALWDGCVLASFQET